MNFVSHWPVLETYAITEDDLDACGGVRDDVVERWVADAVSAYLALCSSLSPQLKRRTRRLPRGQKLGHPERVVVSAGAKEIRPDSFVVGIRLRSIGGDPIALDTGCEIELPTGVTKEAGEELIALEHAAHHLDRLMSFTRSAAFAVIESDGAVLLLEHCYVTPRLWGFPGGMVEPGESLRAAACRESLEETGLVVEIADLVYSFRRDDLALHFFAARAVGGGLRLQAEEISDARWLRRDQVEALGVRLGPRVLDILDAAEHPGPRGR